MRIRPLSYILSTSILLGVMSVTSHPARAADHIDMPQSSSGDTINRPDAFITDFFGFVSGSKFVMILNLHPFMAPDDSRTYQFPTDVKYRFNLDLDSEVIIGHDTVSKEFGGVVTSPEKIREDLVFQVTFDANNKPRMDVTCRRPLRCDALERARLFTGLRAESFIFAPVVRNNVASIVVEFPVSLLSSNANKERLLAWATATVETPAGPFTDLAGRALRSQFNQDKSSQGIINTLHPSRHVASGFLAPDVMIIDISKPTEFPNGRSLSDNVKESVARFTLLPTDQNTIAAETAGCKPDGAFFPCPVNPPASADDIRILGRFPYAGRPYKASQRSMKSSEID